jgi:teichuronic acid biosynthesis glycosyltransferase TuaC
MRVLAVTNMYPLAETPTLGNFIEQQIKGLQEIGLEVEIMLVDRVHDGMSAYFNLRGRLCSRIDSFDPDVVHVMYGGVMAAQASRIVKNKPTVVTFHGSDLLGEHLSGTRRKVLAQVGIWASWWAALNASGIVVVSNGLKNALPRSIDPNRITTIPCGIDLQRFKPLDRDICRNLLGWDKSAFHILFPANNGNPVKRPALAHAALDALTKLGVRAELHYLQGVRHDQVPIWLNASDVLLMTSLHEGAPTIIKEALACDLPVVSVSVGDVAERIQGIQGCFVSLPDPQELAAKMLIVHSGPRRVAGRSKMAEFSLERTAHRLKKVYENVA